MQAITLPGILAAGASVASAASALAQGQMANAQAKAAQKQAKINADIARTRAIQTDVTARQGLADELGTMRAALGSNSDRPSVGTLEILNELRTTRDRERRIQYGARMSEAADYRMMGKNAAMQGRSALLTGLLRAGPSIFDMYNAVSGPRS